MAKPPTKKVAKKAKGKGDRSKKRKRDELKIVEATIHLHKHMHGTTLKKRANKAVKRLREHVRKTMKTKDIRIDPRLNKFVWSGGIKGVPFRARIRMERKRNEDAEGNKEKMYTVVSWVPVSSYKKLLPKVVQE